jgi:hypothetical protein
MPGGAPVRLPSPKFREFTDNRRDPTPGLARVARVDELQLDGEVIAEEEAGSGEATDPVRPLPSTYEEQPGTSLALRPEVRTAVLATAGGVLAGAATVAAVRVVSSAAAKVRPQRRSLGRRGARENVVASRSFLIDVHLLGR